MTNVFKQNTYSEDHYIYGHFSVWPTLTQNDILSKTDFILDTVLLCDNKKTQRGHKSKGI